MTKKEKNETPVDPVVDLEAPLSHLLLTITHDKYRMVSLATRWAKEIKQRDQSNQPPQELLAQALREILGKKVTLEEIEKLPPPPKTEKKDLDFTFPTISLKDIPAEEKEAPAEKSSSAEDQ